MAGDWAYHELPPISAVEPTILGSALALCVNRRSHSLFPLPERPKAGIQLLPSTSPPTAARHPFPDLELPELCRLWVNNGHQGQLKEYPLSAKSEHRQS
jgi:hypothetical protein